MTKPKYTPGIQWAVGNAREPTEDALEFQKLNDEFNRVFGLTHGAVPAGYTGNVKPSNAREKLSWLTCLKENGWQSTDDEQNLFLGEM